MPSRQHFHQPSDSAEKASHLRSMLNLLIAQDGSTTRLCEAAAEGPVTLQMVDQRVVQEVPDDVRSALPGELFIERITCLVAGGHVMMDNLAFVALDGLASDVRGDLEEGKLPIGHLLSRMWVRRRFFDAPALRERLWRSCGSPDPKASRSYCIVTPEGPRMLIAETFRRGMVRERSGIE
jgi:chorismate-pyruvate lyase